MNIAFNFKTQALDSTLQSPSETLLSIRLLDFKTSLLEAIEELRIRRETEINYEEQISKIVVEKQELEWQKVTLFRFSVLTGKYQLAVETKEKEIEGLKEALKALQISKYTLQKKLNEMDQKLQMHLTAKEEHHKKLNEVEKCYATIACQFGIIKGVHGKLEHSVQEAIQLNKKLTSVNKRQETEISSLKEVSLVCISECVSGILWDFQKLLDFNLDQLELKKVTTDLIRSKVTSQYRVGEENINLAAKEKQFQELQQKIKMVFLEFKQSKFLTLERDNELQREKAKENEEKFLNLQNEHEKALRTWKKDVENTLTLTDLQVLENSFKDEINVASPYEEKQREASPRNTLCTDTDLITQGRTSEIHVTECKEAENLGAAPRMLLDENNAYLEQKLQDSTEPWTACHTQTGKIFSDSTDTVGAYKKNGSQETNSSKQGLGNTTDESVCTKADKKSNTIQRNTSVLTPEAPKPKSEVVLCTKSAGCERSTDNEQAKELSLGILSYVKENSQMEYQKRTQQDSDNYIGNGLHKPEKNLLNLSGLNRDKLPFKQTHIDAEDRSYNDSARNINKDDVLRSTGVPATAAQNPPTLYCGNGSSDDATKAHSANMSLSGTFNLCPLKIDRRIYVGDMSSKQPEQDSTEQPGNATNTCTLNAEAVSPVKADGLEIIAHKKPPTHRVSTDKRIPCKKVNDDIQIHSIKNGYSLEINNSTNNTLLKEKKDSLNSTVPGRKFAEGHLKKSCSLPMRTSGNLVNISGRSSFDLSTSDKKAEKTPVYLNFLDPSSCSRVNQKRGQSTWTSASKEPSLLKEKLPCSVENTKITSKAQCQNLSENVDRRETGLGSTSFNRTANTLNTSSIHQDPQGDPSEDRNAVAKTFYDSSFPIEHVSQLKILRTRPQ
uniref:Coiled-coil domain containing 73 n=1 Tax=Athene cunicularia TaxID=194338 RepID=A0A663ME57_ATHCN